MKRATDKTFAWAMTLLGVIALALCIFMAVHAMNGSHMIGCSAGSSCNSVMSSRWSSLFGLIPVSLPAAGLYLAFLLCSVAGAVSDDEELRTMARNCMIAIAGAVSVASMWFIALQIFAVHDLCRYCMTAHTVGIIISIAVIIRYFNDLKSRMWLAGGAIAGVVFAVIQLLTAPSSVYDAGFVEEPLPAVSGMDEPLIGNPDAEHVVEILFDYQCSHCRTMHPWLEEIAEDEVPDEDESANPIVNSAGDCIKFCDATGSVVSTYLDEDGYVVIHYDEVKNASVPYDAVDWRFDQNAYMGYTVKELRFENPGAEYPDNVLKMTMNLYSVKYGEYQSTYYIKCIGVDEIRWES